MAFAENLPAYFLDFAVQASAGSFSAPVIFDGPEQGVLGDRMTSKEYAATFIAGALGPLPFGSAMTVDGVSYKVRTVNAIEDGKLERVILEAV